MKHGMILFMYFLLTTVYGQQNLDNVVGQKECKVCHTNEYGVWEQTLHNKTYKTLHNNPFAKKILKRMRLGDNPRKEELCQKCHYTVKPRGSFIRTIGAIACERCHGAAKGWIEVHNNVKIPKPKRRAASKQAGMFHPGDIYGIANNCYSCHVITDEKLVDVGRHPIGDPKFKFVKETQGKMRHNFVSGKGTNVPASPERKRLFYIVGQSLELKYLLIALSNAKSTRNFFLLSKKQLQTASLEMLDIHKAVNKPETANIIKALKGVTVSPNNKDQMLKAAAQIEESAQQLIANHKIETWTFLDSLLPK